MPLLRFSLTILISLAAVVPSQLAGQTTLVDLSYSAYWTGYNVSCGGGGLTCYSNEATVYAQCVNQANLSGLYFGEYNIDTGSWYGNPVGSPTSGWYAVSNVSTQTSTFGGDGPNAAQFVGFSASSAANGYYDPCSGTGLNLTDVPSASPGTIIVSTNVTAATFMITGNSVSGPVTFTGSGTSATFTVPQGTYTITFGSVPAFLVPDPQTQTVVGGATISFSGAYDTPVIDDTTTQYSIGSTGYPYIPCLASPACDLNPSYNAYTASSTFNISKITFTWYEMGDCDSGGDYVAAISTTNNSAGIIATSTNSVFLGCPNNHEETGEFDFIGQNIPANFYLDFYSLDGLGNGRYMSITVTNVEIGVAEVGTIQVTSNIAAATFSIAGPVNYTGSGAAATFSIVPAGTYTITFGTVAGYTTPAPQTQTVSASGTITFFGNYIGSSPIVLLVPGIFGTKLASSSGVVWLSDTTVEQSLITPQALAPIEYNSSGRPVDATVSVNAILNGVNYGGLFNLASDTGDPQYELDCTGLISLLPNCYHDFYVYNKLVSTLRSAGYPVVLFPYDWREDISLLAAELNYVMNTVISQNPSRPIALVAHSMGGLIVGESFAKYGVPKPISHVVTLGTPFLGSVETYFELRAWDSFYPAISPSDSLTIGEYWTSAYELLPQWPFVDLQNNIRPSAISIYDGASNQSVLPALPRGTGPASALPLAVSVWKSERTVPLVPQAYAIVGSGLPTPTVVTDILSQGECLQGVFGDGDMVVPRSSALGSSWVPKANIGFVKEPHGSLPENPNVISGVLEILAGTTVTALSPTPFDVTPSRTPCCVAGTQCKP